MIKPVLFVTGLGRDLNRAENLKCLYDAYPGEKKMIALSDASYNDEAHSGKYGLMVIDIFPTEHPMPTIMIWHAIQGGKFIGLDDKRTYYRESYARFMDAIIVAGCGGIDMFNQCTKVPRERIFDLGMPRTDRYVNKRKGSGHTAMADKRGYLYVPTFRSIGETPMPGINWDWIDRQLTDDELLIVKSHPYGENHYLPSYKHIIEADRMKPSVDYLYDADVVITDYSSIMFDAYLLNKPVVLFEKRPGYVRTRGMYLEYPEKYCSRYAMDEEYLLEQIRSAKRLRTAEKRCRDYVADACDGHSCERIINFIEEMLENGTST